MNLSGIVFMGKRSKIIRAIKKNPGEWKSFYGASHFPEPIIYANGKEIPVGWHNVIWTRSYHNLVCHTLKYLGE